MKSTSQPFHFSLSSTNKHKMALRMIGDKVMGIMAKQYQAVLGNQLAQYGEYFHGWRCVL